MISWCNTNQGFLSAILALATLFISVYAIYRSSQLQKTMHNRDVKLMIHGKVLEIYNTYITCRDTLIMDEYLFQMEIGYTISLPSKVEAILKSREAVVCAHNEAKLMLGTDKKLIKLLQELTDDYLLLSERCLIMTRNTADSFQRSIAKIGTIHPELLPLNLSELLNHPAARTILEEECTTPDINQWAVETEAFRAMFSFENFDALFTKHLPLEEL